VERILTFDEARACVEEHALGLRARGSERVKLLSALGRVLAEDVHADRDIPPFPRATRDGFAVRAADLVNVPARLRVIGQVKAGSSLPRGVKLFPGCCAEIMTGAPVPDDADAVVMVEFTSSAGDDVTGVDVTVGRSVSAGENIVPRGSEGKKGALLLPRGARLGHAQIAVGASVGKAQIKVTKRPRVGILSTGDEVVAVSRRPGPFQIRNSNSFSLAAQVLAAGAEPVQLPIAPDEPKRLRKLIEQGFSYDLLLLSGGVSMGKYDLVEQVLAEFESEFFFTGVKIQPGKPAVFGRSKKKKKYFVGLPGNPVSTMVTFGLFARPLLDALAGATPQPLVFAKAAMKTEFRTKTGLTRFLPATLSGPHSAPEVELIRWQGSGDVVSMSKANCLLVVPPDKDAIADGEQISVLLP
jgi:molybdopterin molybdotransferase